MAKIYIFSKNAHKLAKTLVIRLNTRRHPYYTKLHLIKIKFFENILYSLVTLLLSSLQIDFLSQKNQIHILICNIHNENRRFLWQIHIKCLLNFSIDMDRKSRLLFIIILFLSSIYLIHTIGLYTQLNFDSIHFFLFFFVKIYFPIKK